MSSFLVASDYAKPERSPTTTEKADAGVKRPLGARSGGGASFPAASGAEPQTGLTPKSARTPARTPSSAAAASGKTSSDRTALASRAQHRSKPQAAEQPGEARVRPVGPTRRKAARK